MRGTAQAGLDEAVDGPRQQAGPRWRGQLGQDGLDWLVGLAQLSIGVS